MPVYNAEKYIRRSLESMLQQTYPHLEILIGNDASTDSSLEIIEQYNDARIRIVTHAKNLGYVGNCNALFKQASGDFIAFQDADDYASIDKFEKQLQAFATNAELGVCGTNFIAYTEVGNAMFCSNYPCAHSDIYEAIPTYFPVKPSSFLLKRSVYETIGGYHLYWDRVGGEDYYWFSHIIEQFECINLQEPLYHYIYSPNSITRTIDNPRKLYAFQVLQSLVTDLRNQGTNALMEQDEAALAALENRYAAPYQNDASYIHVRQAVTAFDQRQYHSALLHMKNAIRYNPRSVYNYKTFLYFARKGLWNTMVWKWNLYKAQQRHARR